MTKRTCSMNCAKIGFLGRAVVFLLAEVTKAARKFGARRVPLIWPCSARGASQKRIPFRAPFRGHHRLLLLLLPHSLQAAITALPPTTGYYAYALCPVCLLPRDLRTGTLQPGTALWRATELHPCCYTSIAWGAAEATMRSGARWKRCQARGSGTMAAWVAMEARGRYLHRRLRFRSWLLSTSVAPA